ncbi:MAG TPA: ATP-binding protein [Gemmatimonadales bacterium]|nr:ATP-binding protein [Gemmatimonadales bacterium]
MLLSMEPGVPPTATSQARLEQLLEVSLGLAHEHSLGAVLQRIADSARELVGARYAALGVLAADGRTLERFIVSGLSEEERARLVTPPSGHGILGLVIRERRVVRLPDLGKHPDSFGFPPGHPVMRSFLGAPVLGPTGVFGNLYLTEKLEGPEFTDEDAYLVQLLASQAGAAVENARLHEASARLIEEVQQLQRARERFFAMVNHELRNALAATYGWAEVLVRKRDPATVPPAAFEVLEAAEGAITLINDLLDLSRLDEDRLRPNLQDVDVGASVQRALTRALPSATAKQVAFDAVLPPRGAVAHTDGHRLDQILANLLSNAVRHTPASSTVTVRVAVDGPRVVVDVLDQGPGVAADDLEQIFDIYMTRAEDGRGLGLGLPLSRRLARLLGGELFALVPAEAGGHFRLTLPTPADEMKALS